MNAILRTPISKLIAEWVRPGNGVLDLGCGDGALLKLLTRRGVRAWGVDIDDLPNVRRTAVASGVNDHQSDLEQDVDQVRRRRLRTRHPLANPPGHAPPKTSCWRYAGRPRSGGDSPNFGCWSTGSTSSTDTCRCPDACPIRWYGAQYPLVHRGRLHDDFCRPNGSSSAERKVFDEGREITENCFSTALPSIASPAADYTPKARRSATATRLRQRPGSEPGPGRGSAASGAAANPRWRRR